MGLSEHLGSGSFIKVDVVGLGIVNVQAPGELEVCYGDRMKLAPAGKVHRFDTQGKALT